MKKQLKNGLLIILSALLVLSIFLLSFSASATTPQVYAESSESTTVKSHPELADERYAFTDGARFNVKEFAAGKNALQFCLEGFNELYANVAELPYRKSNWWGTATSNSFSYVFTLYRENSTVGADPTKVQSVIFYFTNYKSTGLLALTVGTCNYINSEENINVSFDTQENANCLTLAETQPSGILNASAVKNKGFMPKKSYLLTATDFSTLFIDVFAESARAKYYVQLDYEFWYLYWTGVFEDKYKATDYQPIASPSRSIYDIINGMNEDEILESVFYNSNIDDEGYDPEAGYTRALSILGSEEKTVTVKYLVPIEGTPYATHVITDVTVWVNNMLIDKDDVAIALGVDGFNCFDSFCYDFTYNDNEDIYEAYYLKNVWLRAVTTDGNYVDYFLDINQSYEDFYYPFVYDGIMQEDLYEFIFSNRMLLEYPELERYTFDEVYGYFGLVVIPTTYSLNTLWTEMFDTKTSQIGVVKNFSFDMIIDESDYNALLNDYGYTWLERAWNGVSSWVGGQSASFYLVYSEGATDAGIGEGGQTDFENPDGAIEDDVQEGVSVVFNAVGNFFSSIFSDKTTTIIFISALIVAAVAITVTIIVIKNKK